MDANFKALWLGALRSGKYQQGKFYLRSSNSFCCLGVACDLLDSSQWTPSSDTTSDWGDQPSAIADDRLGRMLGLPEGVADTLSSMNDSGNKSFAEIADWIEVNV